MSDRLLILGWHNVEGTWCFPAPVGEGARGLARQLRAVSRWGTVVPLDDAVDRLRSGRPLPPRAVALTFDDGYRDNLTMAVPMLRSLGLPATFFLVPALLGRELAAWWELLAGAFARTQVPVLEWDDSTWNLDGERRRAFDDVSERLKRLDQQARLAQVQEVGERLGVELDREAVNDLFLDWDDARELARAASVGAHSSDHAILANEPAAVQQQNLADARCRLGDELGLDVKLLAYPNGMHGDFSDDTEAAAERAGYRAAVTTVPGWNRPGTERFALRRQVMFPERGWIGFKPLVKPALAELRHGVRAS